MNSLVQKPKLCEICGGEIPAGSPEGACIPCLLDAAIANRDEKQPIDPALSVSQNESTGYFGDYEILGEAGRGGMGIVYRARQFGTQRIVALKLLASGAFASRDSIQRFHIEAQTAASLTHPGIVPVYECGVHEGQYFLTMPFLNGGTLGQFQKNTPITWRRAAQILQSIAEAVAYAHQRGVLHRDLKPGNILIDDQGQPRVSDFGLARLLQEDSGVTLSHAVLGTAAYMAPEQAAGTPLTTATDVYALGAILYELLIGKPPIQKSTFAATLRAIAEETPAPLSRNSRTHKAESRKQKSEIPLDLQTICLKCLEKDPGRRYSSAQSLADDLQRFHTNEPIHARPVTRTERALRWCQRKPALAGSLLLTLILILILLIGSPLAAYRINNERHHAEAEALRARQSLYAADMMLTQNALAENNLSLAVDLLSKHRPRQQSQTRNSKAAMPSDLRGWEWSYYLEQAKGEELFILGRHTTNGVSAVGLLPDGKTAWSAGGDKTVRIWDIPSRRQVGLLPHDHKVVDAAQSPDGRWLVTITGPGIWPTNYPVRLWELTTHTLVGILATNRFPRKVTQFSPDGRFLAHEEIDNGIHIFDLQSRSEFAFLTARRDKIAPIGFAFAPHELKLAYCPGHDGSILLWDIPAKTNVGVFHGHSAVVQALAFSPDGRRLASAALDGTLRVWDVTTRRETFTLRLPNNAKDVWQVVFSPSGESLAVLDETQEVKLLDPATGGILKKLAGHQGAINSVAFSKDGRTIITGAWDNTIRMWDAAPHPPQKTSQSLPAGLRLTSQRSHMYSLSPDGRHLLTVFTNNTFSIWNTRTFVESIRYSLPGTNIEQEALAPGGNVAAFALEAGASKHGLDIVIWDIRSGRERIRPILIATNGAGRMRFSPDGKQLAVSSWPHFYVFDVGAGNQTHHFRFDLPGIFDLVGGTAFSPDGARVAAATHRGWVYIWELQQAASPWAFHLGDAVLNSVAFSLDQRTLVAGGWDVVALLDLPSRRQLPDLNPKSFLGLASAISRDGKTLALAEGQVITLWNLESRQLVGRLRGHHQEIKQLAFSPDDQILVSVSFDAFRLWRAASPAAGEAILTQQ